MSLNSQQMFDEWAAYYDHSVATSARDESFPFAGYERVLDTIVQRAAAQPGMAILDIGTGTGRLAARFAALGGVVTGADFSPEMLARARDNVPAAQFVPVDILGEWPPELNRRFDRIVSSYVFHEFQLDDKLNLLQRLKRDHLAAAGRIVIGDIMFPNAAAQQAVRDRWSKEWDDEFYWLADVMLPALHDASFRATYEPLSVCGGVLVIE